MAHSHSGYPAVRQAYCALRVALVAIPFIAGLDKYFHVLTNWEQYLSPLMMRILGEGGSKIFMRVDGVLEMALGIGVALRPRIFGYLISVWFLGIVINLLTTEHYYDIVLRDLGLSLSAFALGKLGSVFERNFT